MPLQFRTVSALALVAIGIFAGCNVRPGVVHRVEEGDTLTQISHAYGIDVSDILVANHIPDPNQLREGQKILIPGAEITRRTEKLVWDAPLPAAPEVEESAQPAPVERESDVAPSPTATPPKGKPAAKTTKAEKKTAPTKMTRIFSGSPWSWPAEGQVVSTFGKRGEKMHNGIDIRVTPGAPVRAVKEGLVVYKGADVEGYGNLLILRHGERLFSVYAYLGRIIAEKGENVHQGQVIGYGSPLVAKSFVHFELRQEKRALDPMKYLTRSKV